MIRKVTVITLIAGLTSLMACAPEEGVEECLTLETAEVCLPADVVMAHQEANRVLFFGEGGWIELYSVADHPFTALADLAEVTPREDARTIGYQWVLDHSLYNYHLMLRDDGVHRFYEFAGILSVALYYD